MSKLRPLDERIESAREEIKQKENRLKELLQRQKAKERTDRNHRLCQRGAHLESILPDTIPLTFEQFKAYLNKTLLTEYANRILRELSAENASAVEITNTNSRNTAPGSARVVQDSATPVTADITEKHRQAG